MKVPKASDQAAWVWPAVIALVVIAAIGVWFARAKTGAGLDPEILWREAEEDFRAGHDDRTERKIATLAKIRTPTPLDRLLRAQLAMYRKQDDLAVAELSKVSDGEKETAQARLLEGQIELRRNRLMYAEKKLRAAIKADPNMVMPHKELIYIYGVQIRRTELNAEFSALSHLILLAYDNVFHWCLTRNSDWQREEHNKMLQSYLDADPEDRFSRLALAENWRQLGRREDADKVLAPFPESDPDARVIRVWLALDRNDEELADSLLADAPENVPEIDRLIARRALASGDGKTALKHYRSAYQAQPDNRDNVFGMGQALMMTGDPVAAAPFLELAKDHDALSTLVQRAATPAGRNDVTLLKALGAACEKVDRLPEARAWYNLAIQANALDNDAQKALFRITERERKG